MKVYLGPNLFHRQRFLFMRGVVGLKWEIGLSRMIEVKKLLFGFIHRGSIEPINIG